jgi:hypothetical protein
MTDKRNGGESPDPKARGGRRSQKNPVSATSLANLKSWPKGTSGNPNGRPKALVEIMRLARSYAPEAVERLHSIVMDPKAAHRDVIAAAVALLDRGCGRAIIVNANNASNVLTGEGDHGVEGGVLLRAAGQDSGVGYRRALEAEIARLNAEEDEQRADLDAARKTLAAGGEIDAPTRLLLQVKDETS